MLIWIISITLILCGIAAGLIGALLGLGGATILIPILVIYGIPINYASGVGLFSALATSCTACSRLMRRSLVNQRLAIELSAASTLGAIMGSISCYYVLSHGLEYILHIALSAVMFSSIYLVNSRSSASLVQSLSSRLTSMGIMLMGGLLSGLLGIGGGPINLVALYWSLGLSLSAATATSNFIVGVTAATSGSLYWVFGYVQPFIAFLAVLGTVMGAQAGASLLPKVRGSTLKAILISVFAYLATRMLISGLRLGGVLPISQSYEYVISAIAAVAFVAAMLALGKIK
ncbi:anion permease [Thermocladium modestius]|uniref:Probable membrane transporter protein n=1 Tax=Thermocladium modestius TaxID=62609 RepID=A0A830GWV6_9CREN|nr:sulfite exporter TauE/SafE family protein [Thermocladium modestius]GGP19916.1 anion permease [Thermocladium modestius]